MADTPTPATAALAYDLVIFDLDGTLVDSFAFFARSHNRLATRFGFRSLDNEQIQTLRGKPAREIIQATGLPLWKLPQVVTAFRRLVSAEGHEIERFAGVDAALAQLADAGVRLALVSSNSAENCRRLLGEDNWARLAHVACGSSLFGKHRHLTHVLREARMPASRAIYVGDQLEDAQAAARAGIAFAGVSWGYATPEALQGAGPARMLDDVQAITALALA
ncbi:HAD hydrolase-like protein [Pseudoxanthomonas indica]|uniref:Phosphoglycolate phosphatase n=1 Tax=Pseudoxanthomonas indica TaxID=428993 RepID=A0A1T5J4K1_9GAMM|nr:HAD hydrolase-like protein [Pseudoxanthomonas indica]GGD56404.1 phosphoglycolate phosphatase [Pseudoxanthomonas indica]SKC46369.1 phosphoglycolate phosphatase [Pseudoxanthomonas indica]